MINNNELKLCPFCGGNAEITGGSFYKIGKYNTKTPFIAVCKKCGSKSGNANNTEEAIKKWNTRYEIN